MDNIIFKSIPGKSLNCSFIFILQALTHSRTHASGVLWTLDRSEGLEDRDYAAGVTLMHKIVGNAFTNSIQGLMQIGIFLSLFCGVYGMEISGSMATVILFAYVSSMSGTAYGTKSLIALVR